MKIDLPQDRPQMEVGLSDGTKALLSPLGSEDRPLLAEGLAELSLEGRYSRFGRGVNALSDSELDYLADIDLHDHVAWGVAIDGEGVGVGRYINLPDLECAEIAVTVLDGYQGRGLGTLLFRALAAIARSDGISQFCFEFVPDNLPVRRMVSGLDIKMDDSGSALQGRVLLADIPPHQDEEKFVSVMEEARGRLGR